jgi:hypothetical protein
MTLPAFPEALLAVCMFLGAALYTSVGHAGASAYLGNAGHPSGAGPEGGA